MENNIYVAGDVVYLKSGGPRMTVEGLSAQDVLVSYFDGSKLKRAKLPYLALAYSEDVDRKNELLGKHKPTPTLTLRELAN